MARSAWQRIVDRAGAKSAMDKNEVRRALIQDARQSERNKKEQGAAHGVPFKSETLAEWKARKGYK